MIGRSLVLAVLLAATVQSLHAAESFLVVKQNDFAGEDSYVVMPEKAYKEAERELRDESKYVRKALDLAKKAWRENPDHKNMFPTSSVKPRKMRYVARYKDEASANEKCATYIERTEKSKAEKEKRDQERHKRGGRRGGNKEREAEKARREQEREAERVALQEEARDLFVKFLDELKAAAKAKAAEK